MKKILTSLVLFTHEENAWVCQIIRNWSQISFQYSLSDKLVNCFVTRTSSCGSKPWQRGRRAGQRARRGSHRRWQGHRMCRFFGFSPAIVLIFLDAEDSVLGGTKHHSSTVVDQDRNYLPRGETFCQNNLDRCFTLLPCSLNSCTRSAFWPSRGPQRLSSWSSKPTSSSTSCSRARWRRRRQSKLKSKVA